MSRSVHLHLTVWNVYIPACSTTGENLVFVNPIPKMHAVKGPRSAASNVKLDFSTSDDGNLFSYESFPNEVDCAISRSFMVL